MMPKAQSKRAMTREVDRQQFNVQSGFGAVTQIAIEAELEYIKTELRKNQPLMYTISGLLKNDTLCALLDGRLNVDQDEPTEKKPKLLMLRSSFKKFKNIRQVKPTSTLPKTVCEHIDREAFERHPQGDDFDWYGAMCFALRVDCDTMMPMTIWPETKIVEKFLAACVQRYAAMGEAFKDKDPAAWHYFYVAGTTKVKTTLGAHELTFEGAEDLQLINGRTLNPSVKFKTGGHTVTVTDVAQSFVAMGLELPSTNEVWDLTGFTKAGEGGDDSTDTLVSAGNGRRA
jgi:hypothetical protein